ncbi:MAG: DUF6538 domain-containing protein [Pseudomonadota bacterium]
MFRPRGKNQIYYFKRRVPLRFASVHPSPFVEVSLKTRDPDEARVKADAVWDQMLEGWQDKLDGRSDDAERRFAAARKIAQTKGFRYRQMDAVVDLPVADLLARVEAAETAPGRVDADIGAAVLGAVSAPRLQISSALEKYFELKKAEVRKKSDDQLRKWRNPKKKAVRNFISVVGDLHLDEINANDMLDFQAWWLDRINEEGVKPNSANKDIGAIATITKLVAKQLRLGFVPPVSGFSIPEDDPATPPPFSDSWLRKRLIPHLTSPACGMNSEASDIVLACINTGARPSEISNLREEQISLDGVPHINIDAVGREIKTRSSRRQIPLVGASLVAMQRNPAGFPRYRDNPGLSNTVNKYLRENALMETDNHVMYSLRHSFEDRLLLAGVDERVRRDLMGHSHNRGRDAPGRRAKYGAGLPIEAMRDLLEPIAL